MKESISKYAKIGLVLQVAYPEIGAGEGPVLERFESIVADPFFEAVEFSHIKDAEVRKQVKRLLEISHMTWAFGGQGLLLGPGLNLNDLDEEKRLQAVAAVKAGIDEALEMGAVDAQFLSGHFEEDKKEEALQQLVKSTRELCGYAKEKGNLPLCLEVFDYDVDKKSLIGPAPLAARYAEEVCSTCDNFGLLVDLSHIPLLHETIEESVVPVLPYIKHTHMGNGVVVPGREAYGDMHPHFGFPGSENDVPQLKEFLRLLMKSGYMNETNRPILSFEVKPWKDQPSFAVIANAKRTLQQAWAELEL